MKLTETQRETLKAMEDAEGRLTPDAVVEEAKQKSSPLHELFDWDRAKAAHSWWLVTAREVIASVTLIVTTRDRITIKTPVYIRDPDANGQGYRSITSLQQDPVAATEALIIALQTAAGHVRRAVDLAEPLGLRDKVDQLLQQIVGVQRAATEKAA